MIVRKVINLEKGASPLSSMTLTSSEFAKVKKDIVETSGVKDIAATLSVSVGATNSESITLLM